MTIKINFSAYTSFENTKETDLLLEVMHDVHFQMNNVEYVVRLLAVDPIDAINKASTLSEEEVEQYQIN